jgi:seryl-tRNA synthetase
MLDLRLFRDAFEETAAALERRGVSRADVERIRDLDERRRELIARGDELRSRQKELSRRVGSADDAERGGLIEETRSVSNELKAIEPAQAEAEQRLDELLSVLPNLPHPEAPDGVDDADAVELDRFGEPPNFDFDPRDHLDLGEALGIIDVPRAAKVSGSRFAYLLGGAALLQLGLIRYTVDILTGEGFTPVVPPVLTREEALYGTGFLPTGEDQIYAVEKDELYLVGTSEVPLGAFHADEILDGDALPIRYAGISTCFRREAGTYGKDTRGIFRVHQFDKVEMFSFTRPEQSEAEHERMRAIELRIFTGLELHGRVVDIPVGDLGASAARKYDIEVWLPGQDDYRELTSTSNCTDYQARRLKVRYRTDTGGVAAVHTLNGTACAVGRTIIALLESHQQADGSVAVPAALQPYVGTDRIG